MDFYFQVLVEHAWAASVIPFASNAALYAMKAFGTFNIQQAIMMAVLGATAGHMFNWLLGYVLKSLQMKNRFALKQERYAQVSLFFNQYLLFTVLFCAVPLVGKLVPLAAGFFGTRLRVVLPLALVGNALYFGLFLLR